MSANEFDFTVFDDSESDTGRKLSKSCYFNDGRRLIDMILVYDPRSGSERKQLIHAKRRLQLENALKRRGLDLEYAALNEDIGKTCFVKIHAPWPTLVRQAEAERLQMPFAVCDLRPKETSWVRRLLTFLFRARGCTPFDIQEEFKQPTIEYFCDTFDRKREADFMINERGTFFSEAMRIRLTWTIISETYIKLQKNAANSKLNLGGLKRIGLRKRVTGLYKNKVASVTIDEDDVSEAPVSLKSVNINHYLRNRVYTNAFPLHDGNLHEDEDYFKEYGSLPVRRWPIRKYLYESWARMGQWSRYQPLNTIRDYYGEKVGLYFAWLGFYTKMLILPTIVGLFSFLIGLTSQETGDLVQDMCGSMEGGVSVMCRKCPSTSCPYHQLSTECAVLRLGRVFENKMMPFHAVFMAVWAVTFLELWKRKQADLCARWKVSENFPCAKEQMRPAYALAATETRVNPVTQQEEPHLPTLSRVQRLTKSLATVCFFIIVVVGLLAGVVIYKMAGPFIWEKYLRRKGDDNAAFSSNLLTSITASLMSGLFIAIMNEIYTKVAWKITLAELPKTELAFEESYTYKVFIFQFVNFYGALFYLSFIRGQVFATPDEQSKFQDRCPPVGCLLDVTIQLCIIMTGKQAINNIMEIGVPLAVNFYKRLRTRVSSFHTDKFIRWEMDYNLRPPSKMVLFQDYLEMIIQYGFVTMFVPAFPLAPIFALINNIFEIRLDAYKFLTQTRRLIPVRAKDLGPWLNILEVITKLAVLTNALLIAFTTDFVDKFVYHGFYKSHNLTYFNFTFSLFQTEDWCIHRSFNGSLDLITLLGEPCDELIGNYSTCYFRDYRARNAVTSKYERTHIWWTVFAGRIGFVLLFEHFVSLIQSFIRYVISDVPEHVTVRVQRETYLQREQFARREFGAEEEDVLAEWSSDTDSEQALKSWANAMPPELTLNQMRSKPELADAQGQHRRKRPFILILLKKLIFC